MWSVADGHWLPPLHPIHTHMAWPACNTTQGHRQAHRPEGRGRVWGRRVQVGKGGPCRQSAGSCRSVGGRREVTLAGTQ